MCFVTACIYNVRYAFYKHKYNLRHVRQNSLVKPIFSPNTSSGLRLHDVLQMMFKGVNLADNK